MEIRACPRCGSLQMEWVGKSASESALVGLGSPLTGMYNCTECGYHGLPVVFRNAEKYKEFAKHRGKNRRAGKPGKKAIKPVAPPLSGSMYFSYFKLSTLIALLLLLLFLLLYFFGRH